VENERGIKRTEPCLAIVQSTVYTIRYVSRSICRQGVGLVCVDPGTRLGSLDG
jgi:hypothetical protein